MQKWNGLYFERSSLREAGYVLQLGHHPSDWCTNPQRSGRPFTVLHTNGVHHVEIAFCECTEAAKYGTRVQQLRRRRLIPATTTNPQTACTFALLKGAQLLSLQSKLSLYDYYLFIEQSTDATGTAGVKVGHCFNCFRLMSLIFSKDRYKAFLRSLRKWRHIRLAKRGGRSYDPTGIKGTSPGELAVLCPACPIPFVNLPPNWNLVGNDLECAVKPLTGLLSLTTFIVGISIIKQSASMPASDLKEDRFQATKGIQS